MHLCFVWPSCITTHIIQVSRAEEEKRLAQKKKEEEERRIREIEEKKQRDIEEKRQRLEEAEKKRQAMLQAMKDSTKTGPNFTIQKKSDNVSNCHVLLKLFDFLKKLQTIWLYFNLPKRCLKITARILIISKL